MRFLFFITLFISSQAFALEVCELGDTSALEEVSFYKIVDSKKATTFKERQMIHTAVTLQEHLMGLSKTESFQEFFSADGSIKYFKDTHHLYALVNYYPGDNEHGAIFAVSEKMGTSFRKLAGIYDGEIVCDTLE